MQLPTGLLATLRVGLGATALLGSACASTAARGPQPFPGMQPSSAQAPAPVMVAVPVASPSPAQPVANPVAPAPKPPGGWSCEACGMG